MTYRTVLPDFDPATLPEIPAHWTDVTSETDRCPKFSAASGRTWELFVYVDWHEPASDRARFVVVIDQRPAAETFFCSSDWTAVVQIVEQTAAGFKAGGRR